MEMNIQIFRFKQELKRQASLKEKKKKPETEKRISGIEDMI